MSSRPWLALLTGALLVSCTQNAQESAPTQAPQNPTAAGAEESAAPQVATAQLGKPAPDFELNDQDGKPVSLASLRGKIVVLEWFNPECPFVVYAYNEGPLKEMAKTWEAKGDVVWLAINSAAPGKQGHGLEKNRAARNKWNIEHRLLFDPKGEVGRLYQAKTTPHMFVINPEGILMYDGALDNAPFGTVRGDTLQPYTQSALTSVEGGKPVDPAKTTPYGCAVKYAM